MKKYHSRRQEWQDQLDRSQDKEVGGEGKGRVNAVSLVGQDCSVESEEVICFISFAFDFFFML